MPDSFLTVGFDASAFATITNMEHFSLYLDPRIEEAMQQIGDLLVSATVDNTWNVFDHPTGKLASTVMALLSTPMEVLIQVPVPYAWRMEEGFVGTDSLGRVYNQQGKPYARPALTENEDTIIALMEQASQDAFVAMGGRV